MGVMSIAEVMDRSIAIFKKNLKTMILFTLGYNAILLGGGFLGLLVTIITASLIQFIGVWWVGVPIALMVFFFISVAVAYNVGVIKIVGQEFNGKKVLAFEAIKVSYQNIFRVMGLLLVVSVVYIPFIGVFGLILYSLIKGLDASLIFEQIFSGGDIGLGIIMLLIILLTIAVSTIYMSLFTFALPAMVLEKAGVIKSLKRSFTLLKGNFWKIVGFNILVYGVIYVLRVSLESFILWIVGIVLLLFRILSIRQDFMSVLYMLSSVVSTPINLLGYFIFTPIGTMMITLLYFNQRFKKEGFDLLLKIKQMKTEQERNLS